MSNLVQMLMQLATTPVLPAQRQQLIDSLAAIHQLDPALVTAMHAGDTARCLQLAGLGSKGCFVVVAPDDEPAQPDKDDQENSDRIIKH